MAEKLRSREQRLVQRRGRSLPTGLVDIYTSQTSQNKTLVFSAPFATRAFEQRTIFHAKASSGSQSPQREVESGEGNSRDVKNTTPVSPP